MTLFDAFYTGHTQGRSPDEIARCLRESVADLMAAEPKLGPRYDASLDIDEDTRPRGGKSRRALARERRPVSAAVDDLGYDAWGHWVPGGEG